MPRPKDTELHAPGALHHEPRLTWGAGGWILLAAFLLISAVMLWRVRDMLAGGGARAVGDGSNPATYGFDLSTLRVPPKELVGSGLPRDGIPVIDFPRLYTPAQVDSVMSHHRFKYLVPGDRVIGVEWHGQARAYPLNVLNWHEVVNDTLGGLPIAVTYSPLCDAAVVFDRRLDSADAPGQDVNDAILFGHSGLFYNSDLVLYDRRPGHAGESLWSQLQARAIAGPAASTIAGEPSASATTAEPAGSALRVRPYALVSWQDWRERHPRTTVLKPDPTREDRYKRDPYISYYGSDLLRFPAAPLPPKSDEMAYKTRCVIVGVGNEYTVYPLPWLVAQAGGTGIWETRQRGRSIRFTVREEPQTVLVEENRRDPASTADAADLADPEVFYSFWFAWYACRPLQAGLAGQAHR